MNKSIKGLATKKADKDRDSKGKAAYMGYEGSGTVGRYFQTDKFVDIPASAKIKDTFDGRKSYGDVYHIPDPRNTRRKTYPGTYERDNAYTNRRGQLVEHRLKGTMSGRAKRK